MRSLLGRNACFLAELEQVARETNADWIVPITEPSCGTVLAYGVQTTARLCVPPRDAYWRAVDKWETLCIGGRLGLTVPVTHLVSDQKSLSAALAHLRFPVVIKSRFSHFLKDDQWYSGGARRVETAEEAHIALSQSFGTGGLAVCAAGVVVDGPDQPAEDGRRHDEHQPADHGQGAVARAPSGRAGRDSLDFSRGPDARSRVDPDRSCGLACPG